MENVLISNENRVVVITPLHLRHRSFLASLKNNSIQVEAVIVDGSVSRLDIKSFLSLSGMLSFFLSTYEFFKLGNVPTKSVPVHRVLSLADPTIVQIVNKISPRVIVVYGGKVIPKSTLNNLGFPCINVHGSILPGYRGLDSYWWSLAEKKQSLCGYSIHFVEPGIDTGNLLLVKPYSTKYRSVIRHLNWRIWISQSSAREISEIISKGKLDLPGISHSRIESTYRSKIRFSDIIRIKCKCLFELRD